MKLRLPTESWPKCHVEQDRELPEGTKYSVKQTTIGIFAFYLCVNDIVTTNVFFIS